MSASRISVSFGNWAFGQKVPCEHVNALAPDQIPHRHDRVPGYLGAPRKLARTGAEILGAVAVIHGIGMWSIPSAFIVAGLAVIVAVELRG